MEEENKPCPELNSCGERGKCVHWQLNVFTAVTDTFASCICIVEKQRHLLKYFFYYGNKSPNFSGINLTLTLRTIK